MVQYTTGQEYYYYDIWFPTVPTPYAMLSLMVLVNAHAQKSGLRVVV